jgi:hypothetical protein
MTLAEAIVAEARKYTNMVEQPPGSNSNWGGPIVSWLAFVGIDQPASYCAASRAGWSMTPASAWTYHGSSSRSRRPRSTCSS